MRTIYKYSAFFLLLIHLQHVSKAQKPSDTLRLLNRSLKEIPDSVFSLINLRELDLGIGWVAYPSRHGAQKKFEDQNQITTISPKIANLKNLEYLDLSSNDISILPKEFKELKSLSILSLSNNVKLNLDSTIKILKMLPKLRRLVLIGIPGIVKQRKKIQNELPHVKEIWLISKELPLLE